MLIGLHANSCSISHLLRHNQFEHLALLATEHLQTSWTACVDVARAMTYSGLAAFLAPCTRDLKCGQAGVLRGRPLGAVVDHRAAWRASTPSICGLSVEEQAAASRENLYSVAYGCGSTRTRSGAWRGRMRAGEAPKGTAADARWITGRATPGSPSCRRAAAREPP